jgi:hypothetical protein
MTLAGRARRHFVNCQATESQLQLSDSGCLPVDIDNFTDYCPFLKTISGGSELQGSAYWAYSTADFQPAAAGAQKPAMNTATEAEGLYWETRSVQKLATSALAQASQLDIPHALGRQVGDTDDRRSSRNFPRNAGAPDFSCGGCYGRA